MLRMALFLTIRCLMSKTVHEIWTYAQTHPLETRFIIDISELDIADFIDIDGDDVPIEPLLEWMEKNKRVVIPRRPYSPNSEPHLSIWIDSNAGVYLSRWIEASVLKKASMMSEDEFADVIAIDRMKVIPIDISRFRVIHMMVDNIDRIIKQTYMLHYRKLRKRYLNATRVEEMIPHIIDYIRKIQVLGLSVSSMVRYARELGCDIPNTSHRHLFIIQRLSEAGQSGDLACIIRDVDVTSIVDTIADEALSEVKCRLGDGDWVSLW